MHVLRFVTPTQLAICLILFFLPWIEVQCPMPDLANMKFEATPPRAPGKAASIKPATVTYTSLLTQSGFQIATGKYTFTDPKMQQMLEMEKAKGEGSGSVKIEKKKEIDTAPLLFAYPLAAIAGIVIGLAMPGSVPKKGLLLGCCLAVLLVTAGQAAMGFPIEKAIHED